MPFVITATPQLGKTLRGLRKSRKMTQAEVAKASGMLQKTVSNLEVAPDRCSVGGLLRYLAAVRVTMSLDLTTGSPSNTQGDQW
jgi:DNA-binding XRE family transcriptional regulator